MNNAAISYLVREIIYLTNKIEEEEEQLKYRLEDVKHIRESLEQNRSDVIQLKEALEKLKR